MKKLKIFALLFVLLSSTLSTRADEGMWLLSLLKGYTIEDMQKEGFKLTAEDIYSVNQACLKDAVVIFGGGCTGELISNKGLLLTNHHCGYGAVQSHSSVENDYLTNGFWAMSKEEELPNPGLSVTFLRYMEDVTEKVQSGIKKGMSAEEKAAILQANVDKISVEAAEDGKYEVQLKSMFYGNQYFIFVYEKYLDVRLVGAPPSSIGNFGEDSDNWMWPRHTGDFTVFRIYANKDNEPASYCADNIPYVPKKSLEISMDGVQEGDFTMLIGYPGSTQQFLYSDALDNMINQSYPLKIDLRTKRLEIMGKYMKESDAVRIQYASKYRGVSNAWKKWKGVIRGLKKLDAINVKHSEEEAFGTWVSESPERHAKYAHLFPQFEDIYTQLSALGVLADLQKEAIYVVELPRFASTVRQIIDGDGTAERLQAYADYFYKDYYNPIDEEIFASMMEACYVNMDDIYHPEFFSYVEKKYAGDFRSFAADIYSKTVFSSAEEFSGIIALYKKSPEKALRKLDKEPLLQYMNEFNERLGDISSQYSLLQSSLNVLYHTYVQGIMEMNPEQVFYPDANFTMRIAYGKVEGYEPVDATNLRYYTTLSGVIEKSRMGRADYLIPSRLEDLFNAKDYGRYGENGMMPVCFIASNHSSGGNSGSPILDANGRLIGLNFDRNWEGTMSDEMYDLTQCRNISVDIRYVLFIIDKYAGAGYLLDEMVLVKTPVCEEADKMAGELIPLAEEGVEE